MNLLEIAQQRTYTPEDGVPHWMRGHFRRRTISFANGESDERTNVHWLQSRTFTIDLRLPDRPPLPALPFKQYSQAMLRELSNYEGWMADSEWNGQELSWHGGVSLQWHNRWPEPAQLHRIGNCMIEFCRSGTYVEDWRLQRASGPLIGLRLMDERDALTGQVLHRGGGLIVCGDRLAWTHGRATPIADTTMELRDRAQLAHGNMEALASLFDFETSLAYKMSSGQFNIALSTLPARIGCSFDLEGFEWLNNGEADLCQRIQNSDGQDVVRTFKLDLLQSDWSAQLTTPNTQEGRNWFCAEAETLGRHLTFLS